MFDNFLRVLGKGKSEHILLLKLWDDLERNEELCIMSLPACVSIEWIKETKWYRLGGWQEVRKAAYGPVERQLDMQFHGVWAGHVREIKEQWPKPE